MARRPSAQRLPAFWATVAVSYSGCPSSMHPDDDGVLNWMFVIYEVLALNEAGSGVTVTKSRFHTLPALP